MKNKAKGIRVINIILPFIMIIFALYAFIIVTTVVLNNASKDIIYEMDRTAICNRYISSLQSRNSKLSETSSAFVENPIVPPYTPDPTDERPRSLNDLPITGYVDEIKTEESGSIVVLEKLQEYNLGEDILSLVEEAANKMDLMIDAQYHAIYLAYAYVERKGFDSELDAIIGDAIPLSEYSEDTSTLSDIEILSNSKGYISGEIYNKYKSTVLENLRDALQILNQDSSKIQSNLQFKLKMARGFLWGSILLIVIFNIIFVLIVVRNLVIPMIKFAKIIDDNDRLEKISRLYETNRLVDAYNSLLDRHNEFEKKLRDVAEIDSLTNLPNRYCYNEFLKKEVTDLNSVAVFLFDINNLKYVNDTFGHSKGDELIKNASLCIKDCFLDSSSKNCYRIGGDEFVAILSNIQKDEILDKIEKFIECQKKYDVSIAVGYAFTANADKINMEKLIIKADKEMYKNKSKVKKEMENDAQ